MGKTLAQLRADVQANLSDYSINFLSATDINNSLQDAYNDTAILTQCIQKKLTINFISNLSYYNFLQLGVSDYLGTIAIFNNISNLWLRDDLNLKDFDRIRRDWETWIGTPLFWSPSDPMNIAICPKFMSSEKPSFVRSSTSPNGVVTAFSFPSIPLICSFNGLNQFLGTGFTLQQVGTSYLVTFLDVNGNVITPDTGDEIYGYLTPTNLGSFVLYYWAQAPILTSDNDTFLVASDMQQMLTQFATADCIEQAQEGVKADDWWNQYYANVDDYADRIKRNCKSDLLLRI